MDLVIPRTNKKDIRNRSGNYETIKLDPRTMARLRNCYYDDQANRPDTINYDELLNLLMDKVE